MRGLPQGAPRRRAWLLFALAVSVLLHAAALAALLLWPGGREMAGAAERSGVALVFVDTGAVAGLAAPGAPAAPEPPAEPPGAEAAAASAAPETPRAAAPAAPDPPPGDLAVAEAMPDASPPPAAAPPAASPPGAAALPLPPPEPPPPPPAPAPPVPRAAERPERSAPAAGAEPVRLGAGAAALPDPSLGARALGAVVPPGPEAGHRNAPPDYPPESRRRGEEGVVRLALRIDAEGRVQAVEVTGASGHPALDRAAVAAARRWRFRPATQGGLPVPATLSTAVHFRLTEPGGR